MSSTLVSRLSRVPSCWIDWSWAAQVAIRWKSWAVRIATLAWVASAATVSQLVVGPVVRLVVVDVEHAEESRCRRAAARADRVEALLDDRGADVLAARVVAVADGEQRPARGDGGALDRRPRREVADAGEVARRQAAADLGDGVPSGRRRKTAARSPSNRTMAWSTRPARIRSRSSRLPMSLATRRAPRPDGAAGATSSRSLRRR